MKMTTTGLIQEKDEKALREIDAMVYFYYKMPLNFKRLTDKIRIENDLCLMSKDDISMTANILDIPHFTTSRDAIKSIRLDGWGWSIQIRQCIDKKQSVYCSLVS